MLRRRERTQTPQHRTGYAILAQLYPLTSWENTENRDLIIRTERYMATPILQLIICYHSLLYSHHSITIYIYIYIYIYIHIYI